VACTLYNAMAYEAEDDDLDVEIYEELITYSKIFEEHAWKVGAVKDQRGLGDTDTCRFRMLMTAFHVFNIKQGSAYNQHTGEILDIKVPVP
jgi:hypothetical protein